MGSKPRLAAIPERITRARIEAGLTPKQLADKMGVSRQSIWYYESGECSPKAPVLAKIAEATHRHISYFLPPDEEAA